MKRAAAWCILAAFGIGAAGCMTAAIIIEPMSALVLLIPAGGFALAWALWTLMED